MFLNSQFGPWNDFVFLCHWLFENWMYVPNSVTDFRQTWPLCIKWFSAFSFIHCKIKALIWAFVHHCVPHCLSYIVCSGNESTLRSDFFLTTLNFIIAIVVRSLWSLKTYLCQYCSMFSVHQFGLISFLRAPFQDKLTKN